MNKRLQRSYPGDWPEDFQHENGNYLCRCFDCNSSFWGYKWRMTCKICVTKNTPERPTEKAPGE